MPDDGKPFVIDGFHSVQAVRRVRDKSPAKEPRFRDSNLTLPAVEKPKAGDKPEAPAPAMRAGQTTMPTRHDIVCYACGYAFVHTGRLHKVLCPKCREFLNTQDHEIDGAWDAPIRTLGTVTIKSGAVFGDAAIVANRLIVAGDIRRAAVQWCRALELCEGAVFDVERFGAVNLTVHEGARFDIGPPLTCGDLDVRGELDARVTSTGSVVIRAGGFLKGELTGKHLTVEEGGGINGRLAIRPDRQGEETAR